MTKDEIRVSRRYRLNRDKTFTEISDKSVLENLKLQYPDKSQAELEAALNGFSLRVLKAFARKDYMRLKNQAYDDMPPEDQEIWLSVRLLFADEIEADSHARFEELKARLEAQDKREREMKRYVMREIGIAEALAEPLFLLRLPDEYLMALAEAGFTSIGQVLYSIKVKHETMLEVYLNEADKAETVKLKPYLRLIRRQLSEIVGEVGKQVIGSRLLEYKFMTINEYLDAFKGNV
jgi:hypothetical protein